MRNFSTSLITSILIGISVSACTATAANNDNADAIDIGAQIFTNTSAACADYANSYTANVSDIQRDLNFDAELEISFNNTLCFFHSDSIPNHDFNDSSASFASDAKEVDTQLSVSRNPKSAKEPTAIAVNIITGIMLNGVVLDLAAAGCYQADHPRADADGNIAIGCTLNSLWALDPLSTDHKFGADAHNAHVQPGGLYHYHGNPNALFDDHPSTNGSPVIGFAADGFPIYGSYFYDSESGKLTKATSGYTLKAGERAGPDSQNPGGMHSGIYTRDWEYTKAGNLDACNGRTVNGQYAYYVTDSYPWVLGCFSGTPHASFVKQRPPRRLGLGRPSQNRTEQRR